MGVYNPIKGQSHITSHNWAFSSTSSWGMKKERIIAQKTIIFWETNKKQSKNNKSSNLVCPALIQNKDRHYYFCLMIKGQDWIAQTSIKYKNQLKLHWHFFTWNVHKINLHLRFKWDLNLIWALCNPVLIIMNHFNSFDESKKNKKPQFILKVK